MGETEYKRYTCEGCNSLFDAVRAKRYCTRQCNIRHLAKIGPQLTRAEYVAKTRENAASKFTCEFCGIEAHRKIGGRNKAKGYVNRWCSQSCRSASSARQQKQQAELLIKSCSCEICGSKFDTTRNGLVCSSACREEKARRCSNDANRKKVGDKKPCACKQCGIIFIPNYGDKRSVFCGPNCQRKYDGKTRGNDHRKRARYYGVAYEPVNRLKVFDRDGWRCQICGKNTPIARLGSMTTNAPELDHRTPLSKGGGHLYSNVQCACRRCNSDKGNRSEVGQMPLLPM